MAFGTERRAAARARGASATQGSLKLVPYAWEDGNGGSYVTWQARNDDDDDVLREPHRRCEDVAFFIEARGDLRDALDEIERLEHDVDQQIADAVRAAIADEREAIVRYLRDPARTREAQFSPHTWAKAILAGAHLRASVSAAPCASSSEACTRRGSERIEVMQ